MQVKLVIMDTERHKRIASQIERWDAYARLVPTIFLVVISALSILELISIETAFYLGLGGFAFTAVVWWWWTIFTIKYLITALNRASKNLREVNNEVKEITQEVNEMKNG